MLSSIRSAHRSTTPITRVASALPALPHPHRKRRRRVGAAAILRAVAGLVAVLVGTAAVMFRDRLTSMVTRGQDGEEPASDQQAANGSRGDGGQDPAPDASVD